MKLGIRTMYLITGFFLCLGQFVFSLGCTNNSMQAMLIGRMLFGFGGETINIAQNCMIVKWFRKDQISFPLGLAITVSRLGSVLNDVATPQIATVSFFIIKWFITIG